MSPQATRRPWLAMALSMALPGLGQVYNGQVYKGLTMFALLALMTPASAWLAVHLPVERGLTLTVIAGALSALALYAWSIADARRTAHALTDGYSARPYNQGYAYVAFFLCGYAFVLSPLVAQTKAATLELFKVPTRSMVPALLPGDRFFVDKNVNRSGGAALWRGAIAVLTYPNNRTLLYVKRVIGLPGDHIEIKDSAIFVNGRPIEVPYDGNVADLERRAPINGQLVVEERGERGTYLVLWKRGGTLRKDMSIEVPAGQVFVLGDNRDATEDSRQFGVVPLADIVGVARQTLVSFDDDGIDWGSIGRSLH
jgi:signal peptidase I